jgi:hypothetical protein
LNNIHIWGAPLDLEMDVLASLNGLFSLALNAESVDDYAILGQITSIEELWLNGELTANDALNLTNLFNLRFASIGWGVTTEAFDALVPNWTSLQRLELSSIIVNDLSFLLTFNDFSELYLFNATPVLLSQLDDLRAAGLYVEQNADYHYVDVSQVIGHHTLFEVELETDPVTFADVPVTFNSDFTGTIDWGFGEEGFTWSVDNGQVLIFYDNTSENDRWTWYNVGFNAQFIVGSIGIEVDEDGDGVYDVHSERLINIDQSSTHYVVANDLVGSHTFTDPNDNLQYTISFFSDNSGQADWGNGIETFVWSFDEIGRVIVDYDDAGTTEIDRWTWSSAERDASGNYLSGIVSLEISSLGDGNYDTLDFVDVLMTKD